VKKKTSFCGKNSQNIYIFLLGVWYNENTKEEELQAKNSLESKKKVVRS